MADSQERAFPSSSAFGSDGMSLRDWFAGHALAGITGRMFEVDLRGADLARHMAIASYQFADAMLAARQEVK